MTLDLRNIRSPIVVFCSKGDNITPPGQALGWIVDLYSDVDEVRSYGQTIIYTVHETIGHLGIFVSSGVARKEHGKLSSNIDLIDTLPPGLYEAVFERKGEDTTGRDLVSGDWVMRCEARTLEDIRMLGSNSAADERCFATAARISETNLALYRAFVQPGARCRQRAIGAVAAKTSSAARAIRAFLGCQSVDGRDWPHGGMGERASQACCKGQSFRRLPRDDVRTDCGRAR